MLYTNNTLFRPQAENRTQKSIVLPNNLSGPKTLFWILFRRRFSRHLLLEGNLPLLAPPSFNDRINIQIIWVVLPLIVKSMSSLFGDGSGLSNCIRVGRGTASPSTSASYLPNPAKTLTKSPACHSILKESSSRLLNLN